MSPKKKPSWAPTRSKTVYQFAQEKFEAFYEDAELMGEFHFDEIKDTLPAESLTVNVEMYNRIEDAGLMRTFTVRENHALIGYALYIAAQTPRSGGKLCATQEVLYIDPQHRMDGLASRFIGWCDGKLRDEGVVWITQIVPARKGFQRLLGALGYERKHDIYTRVFEDEQ